MAKLLTNREAEIFRLMLNYVEQYYDKLCSDSPLGGFWKSREELAVMLSNELSFDIDSDDLAEICESVEGS